MMKWEIFVKKSIKAKIAIGYAFMAMLLVGAVLVTIWQVKKINVVSHRVADLRAPTAENSLNLLNGVNHSLAALRGWMILGEDEFRVEREKAWSVEIEPSLVQLKKLSMNWTNPQNVERLKSVESLLVDFKRYQQEIEGVAHSDRNLPGTQLLREQGVPKFDMLMEGITRMIDLEKSQRATPERKNLLALMADVRGSLGVSFSSLRAFLHSGVPRDKEEFQIAWKTNSDRFNRLSNQEGSMTREQGRIFQSFRQGREEYLSLVQKMFDIREGKDWNLANHWLENNAAPAASLIIGDLRVIVDNQGQMMAEDMATAKQLTNRLSMVGWWLLGIGVTASTLLGILLSRSISRPIQEGINALSSAASELSSTATQLASNASETASSVNETTTTVEEVKQTSHVSNQKAEDVTHRSEKVYQVLQSGTKTVQETIEGMARIQTQMEFIAESIVRLSEQSQSIGEIISTVNDLTEQSNLLAVNASIEAAKAAEHGKGFAVVALEIKSLADQSKHATTQVQTILSDIQKATSNAVMATEQGSKAVEEGVKQSKETGEAIKTLTDGIREAAQAATQIAASCQQQLVGMNQVAQAMDNINLATQQTLSGTKQTETTAQNLNDLGKRLKRLVEGTSTRSGIF